MHGLSKLLTTSRRNSFPLLHCLHQNCPFKREQVPRLVCTSSAPSYHIIGFLVAGSRSLRVSASESLIPYRDHSPRKLPCPDPGIASLNRSILSMGHVAICYFYVLVCLILMSHLVFTPHAERSESRSAFLSEINSRYLGLGLGILARVMFM